MKSLLPLFRVYKTVWRKDFSSLLRNNTIHNILRAQAVYPFAPSCLPNSKDGKSRQGREARSLSLTAFSGSATHYLSKRNLGKASINCALR